MAVKFDTTGKVERKPLDVVKKLSIVVTPESEWYIACISQMNSYILKVIRILAVFFTLETIRLTVYR